MIYTPQPLGFYPNGYTCINIVVGVPTVIDLNSLVDGVKLNEAHAMVVPRDIDITVNHYAKVISKAVNRAVNPTLSPKEIERLLF